jgi:hypothetical protein
MASIFRLFSVDEPVDIPLPLPETETNSPEPTSQSEFKDTTSFEGDPPVKKPETKTSETIGQWFRRIFC